MAPTIGLRTRKSFVTTTTCKVEGALIEMNLAGVSVRRVEDSTEVQWGTTVSTRLVSDLKQKIYAQIEACRKPPIRGAYACVDVDGMWPPSNHCSGNKIRITDSPK